MPASMSATPPDLNATLATGAYHLLIGKYWGLASFVMLVYDHLITFSDEIDRIWKQRISGASILFAINRYGAILQYIVILDAFHDPRWTKPVCEKFVYFEGASTIGLIAVCQLIMILRVYALYGRSIPIVVFLLTLWAAQIIISSIGVRDGFMAPLPPPLTGCILTGTSKILSSVWIAPLVTDSCIFGLTLWRTHQYFGSGRGPGRTLHVFVRDGALYFFAIFIANALNLLLYLLCPPDLKPIGASFSQLITNVMISRLVLNLRHPSTFHSQTSSNTRNQSSSLTNIRVQTTTGKGSRFEDKSFLGRTIDTLGAEVQSGEKYQDRLPMDRTNFDMTRPWRQSLAATELYNQRSKLNP